MRLHHSLFVALPTLLLVAVISGCSIPNVILGGQERVNLNLTEQGDCPVIPDPNPREDCIASVGDEYSGILEEQDNGDRIMVVLEVPNTYEVVLSSDDADDGSQQTKDFEVYDSSGARVILDDDNRFAPEQGGAYFVVVSGAIGVYRLSINRVTTSETTDCSTNIATECRLNFEGTTSRRFTGTVGGAGDSGDWIEVTLDRNVTYRITVTLVAGGARVAPGIYRSDDQVEPDRVDADDRYTATEDGDHYIGVALGTNGGYTLTIARIEVAAPPLMVGKTTPDIIELEAAVITLSLDRPPARGVTVTVVVAGTAARGSIMFDANDSTDENLKQMLTFATGSGEPISTAGIYTLEFRTAVGEEGLIELPTSGSVRLIVIDGTKPTVGLDDVSSLPARLFYGTDLMVEVSASGAPATVALVGVEARHADGSVVKESIEVNPDEYENRQVIFRDLRLGEYTVSAEAPIRVVNVDGTTHSVTVNAVQVNLTTTQTSGLLAADMAFRVMAQVASSDYSGRVELSLSDVGSATPTLDLRGTVSDTHNYGVLAAGSYTLKAGGTGIAAISDITFSVVGAPAIATPIVVDDDVEVQVAIVDGTQLTQPIPIELRLSGATTRTAGISLPAGINPYTVARFEGLAAGTYTLTAAPVVGLTIDIPDSSVTIATIVPTNPAGVWVPQVGTTSSTLHGVAYGAGRWVAVGANDAIRTTADPTSSWGATTSGAARELWDVGYANGVWVAVGANGTIRTATDPAGSWAGAVSGTTEDLMGVGYANGRWVAVGANGTIRTATDPTSSWAQTSGATEDLMGVAYGNGRWVAVGANGTIRTTTDPTSSWISATNNTTDNLVGVGYADGHWVAVGDAGTIRTARNPAGVWAHADSGTTENLAGVGYADFYWVAVGAGGTLRAAINPTGTWAGATSGTTGNLAGVGMPTGVGWRRARRHDCDLHCIHKHCAGHYQAGTGRKYPDGAGTHHRWGTVGGSGQRCADTDRPDTRYAGCYACCRHAQSGRHRHVQRSGVR